MGVERAGCALQARKRSTKPEFVLIKLSSMTRLLSVTYPGVFLSCTGTWSRVRGDSSCPLCAGPEDVGGSKRDSQRYVQKRDDGGRQAQLQVVQRVVPLTQQLV